MDIIQNTDIQIRSTDILIRNTGIQIRNTDNPGKNTDFSNHGVRILDLKFVFLGNLVCS